MIEGPCFVWFLGTKHERIPSSHNWQQICAHRIDILDQAILVLYHPFPISLV